MFIKAQITYNNFEISRLVFIPNIITNHAITYTNRKSPNLHNQAKPWVPVIVVK